MKKQAVVVDINDPKNLGRIRVQLQGYSRGADITPWVYPCTCFAGPGYGWFCLPVIGDVVWVERTSDQCWVFTGFHWTTNKPIPESSGQNVRVFQSPAGHRIKFDDQGDIELTHAGGNRIILSQNGNVKIEVANGKEINLGGEATEHVLLGESFQAVVNDLISKFNGHTHIVNETPTGKVAISTTDKASPSGSSDLSKKVVAE